MTVGDASAWLYWWWEAISTNDNEGLVLQGGGITKRYYTFGNFSKYVRPGFHRVGMTGDIPADVMLSAYSGTGGALAIVAINETNGAVDLPITIAGGRQPR